MGVYKLNIDQKDIEFMKIALEEAKKGRGFTNPNPMVGAVIVKDGEIIAKGYHHRCGEGHAEVEAYRNAGDTDVTGATIYVTLEPCSHYGKTPPCADLIVSKKPKRVVVAALDPNPKVSGRGIEKIKNAGIEVVTGVLADESIKLNEIFMKYIVNKEPFVLYKSAMSLDGKIAAPSGESQWISCEESRAQVQELRHIYMGIMVGVQTVIDDDPMLNCRMEGGRDPVRIVADSAARIPLDSRLVKTARQQPLIIACTDRAEREKVKKLEDAGAQVIILPEKKGHVDLSALMRSIGEMGIDSVLIEGGASIAYSAFESGIVDKVRFYIAPKIIGGENSKTPIGGSGIERLADAYRLSNISCEKVGEDICICADI